MSESVGVVSVYDLGALKRYALMFDKLWVSNPWRSTSFYGGPDPRDLSLFTGHESANADVAWLRQEGFVLDYEPTAREVETLVKADARYLKYAQAAADTMLSASHKESGWSNAEYCQFGSYIARRDAIILQKAGINALPVLRELAIPELSDGITKEIVVSCVIRELPLPDDLTSWEDILHFKRDERASSAFLALKRWTSQFAATQATCHDIGEELEYLLDQYTRHLRLHRIKTSNSFWETLMVGGASLLENLAKLKFSEIAQGLFRFKKQRIALMEAELKFPGKEVAYICRAADAFQSRQRT